MPTDPQDFEPVVRRLTGSISVRAALRRFRSLPGCLLLESSSHLPTNMGRHSFLMADPFESITVEVGAARPFERLRETLQQFPTKTIAGLPPMQGGIAGAFSYDLNQSLENINSNRHDDIQAPALAVGVYDVVLAWDHQSEKVWLISQGFPETDPVRRLARAEARANQFEELLSGSEPASEFVSSNASQESPGDARTAQTAQVVQACDPAIVDDSISFSSLRQSLESDFFDVRPSSFESKTAGHTHPETSTEDDANETLAFNVRSNFQNTAYIETVQRCIEYIYAGDVFQINLAQQLVVEATSSAYELYQQIRKHNPSTFAAYFDLTHFVGSDLQIVSASPERLFAVRDRRVETRPIKGTRPRTGKPQVDLHEQDRLLASEKDRAENTMIVDLMRNDLSIVCEDDSIQVTQWCDLEAYQNVLHLVSAVEGNLHEDCDLVDLLTAVFPGGSITGAPKVRAMEIIAELEPTSRGFYCGSLGYLGFDGSADLNILIRTITAHRGWWQLPVGGGIVSQSNATLEYQETWTKASAMLNAVQAAGSGSKS